MLDLPITFYLDYTQYPEAVRRMYLREFALNGGKYVVLNERMIKQIMRDPAYADILQRELAAENLELLDSHAPFAPGIDMNMPFDDEFQMAVLRHKLHLNIAAMLNVRTMTIHVGNDARYPEYPLARHMERICRMLDALLPEAEDCKVIICIENIWFRNNTPERLLEIKAKFPTDALGFCYDAAHANIMNNGRHYTAGRAQDGWQAVGEIPQWDDRILEKMLPHIVNCHLHDNNGAQDDHHLPGHGCVDWDHVIDLFQKAPRLQLLQSEVITARHGIAVKRLVECFHNKFHRA